MQTFPYNQAQMMAFSLIPHFSGFLSVLGSSAIVHHILFVRRKALSMFHNRVMLCMSFMDILQSIGFGLSTIPAPRDTPFVYGALGNTTTCEIQGFMLQLGFAVPFYNAGLSLYYVLTIRYGWNETSIRKSIEPILHALALIMNMAFAIAGLIMKHFNNIGNVCFIAPFPAGCAKNKSVECTRGENGFIFLWLFSGIWILFFYFFIPLNMFNVFRTVKERNKAMDKYTFEIRDQLNSGVALSAIEALRRKRTRQKRANDLVNEVAFQGTLYVLAFFLSFIWSLLLRFAEQVTGEPNSPTLIMLAQTFYPLQGFFNYLIFIRTRVKQLRKQNPSVTLVLAMYKATFSTTDVSNLNVAEPTRTSSPKRCSLWLSSIRRFRCSKTQSNQNGSRNQDSGRNHVSIDDNFIKKHPNLYCVGQKAEREPSLENREPTDLVFIPQNETEFGSRTRDTCTGEVKQERRSICLPLGTSVTCLTAHGSQIRRHTIQNIDFPGVVFPSYDNKSVIVSRGNSGVSDFSVDKETRSYDNNDERELGI